MAVTSRWVYISDAFKAIVTEQAIPTARPPPAVAIFVPGPSGREPGAANRAAAPGGGALEPEDPVAAFHHQQAMPSASLYSIAAERLAEKHDVICIRLSALETQCAPPYRSKHQREFTWRIIY
jgi:hypothetical protein